MMNLLRKGNGAHLAVLNKFYIILRIKLSTKNFHSSI